MGISLTVFIRSRTSLSRMSYSVVEFNDDIQEAMHNALMKHSDEDWECIKVRFDSIDFFDI